MPPNHGKRLDQDISLELKGNASLIESKSTKQRSSRNSEDCFTDISSISSFTHESQKEKHLNVNLRERLFRDINKKSQDILQGIKCYDKFKTGKILPVNLYNVLRIFCFPLTFKEFNSLIKEEPEDENGFISYKSFLSSGMDNREEYHFAQPHHDTLTELDSLGTEELEIKIKNKIRKNLKNFIRCMWLNDFNNDGLIQKEDLKTVLENLCFPLSDELFNRFWSLYDPCNSGVINYTDFLLKLGSHAESYKRIFPQSKKSSCRDTISHSSKYSREEQLHLLHAKLGRDDPTVQGQFFNKILAVFKERVKSEFPLLMRTLQIKDPKRTGLVSLSIFHQVLNYFVMPTSLALFKEILRSLNVSTNTPKVAWYLILKKISANGDVSCESNQASLKGSISWKTCKSVFENLKKNGKNVDNFFKNAFTMPIPNHQQAITRSELRKIINESLLLPVSDEEFKHMMLLLDPSHTNFIDCQKILSLFKIVSEDKESFSSNLPNKQILENKKPNPSLSGEKLRAIFKKCFNQNFKNIEKALFAFDSEESGVVNIGDFKKVLDVFCFPLTENQFFELVDEFITSNKIYYEDFICANKKGPYEDEEKWKACIKKLSSPSSVHKQKLDLEELVVFIKDLVVANKESFMRNFVENDLCNTGAVRKEIFSKMLQKHVFKLTNNQFEHLWSKLPKNEIGFLKYEEFLNKWCSTENSKVFQPKIKPPLSTRSNSIISVSSKSSRSSIISEERPKTTSSIISTRIPKAIPSPRPKSAVSDHSSSNLSVKSNSHLSIQSNTYTDCGILTQKQYNHYKSLNLGKKDNLLKPTIKTNTNDINEKCMNKGLARGTYSENDYENTFQVRWRDILRRCKQHDTSNQDSISWNDFIDILQRTGINVNEDVIKSMESRYNLRKGEPVSYWIFLNKCLSKLKLQNYMKIDNMKDWNPNHRTTPSHESVGLCKVLLNYRDKILKNYRDLQHAFRRADPLHTKEISTLKFRKILTLHKIYMKDHDLFYVQDYFDPTLSEKIPYDKFLKAFVKV